MQTEPGQQGSPKREEGRRSRAAGRPGTKCGRKVCATGGLAHPLAFRVRQPRAVSGLWQDSLGGDCALGDGMHWQISRSLLLKTGMEPDWGQD